MVLTRFFPLVVVLLAGIHAARAQQDDCHDGSGAAACPVAPFKKLLPDAPVEAMRGGGGHGGGAHSGGGHSSSGGHASSGGTSHASTGPAGPGGRVVVGGGFFHGSPRPSTGGATGGAAATCLCGAGCLQGFTNYCYSFTNGTVSSNGTDAFNATDFTNGTDPTTNATNVMCCNKGYRCSGDQCIRIENKPLKIFLTVLMIVLAILVGFVILVKVYDLCVLLASCLSPMFLSLYYKITGKTPQTPPQDQDQSDQGGGQQPGVDPAASGFGLKTPIADLERGSERDDRRLLEPKAEGDHLAVPPPSDAAQPTYQQNPLFGTRLRAGEPPAFGFGFPSTGHGSGAAAL